MDVLRLAFLFRVGDQVHWRGPRGRYTICARRYVEGAPSPGFTALPPPRETPAARYEYLLQSGLVVHANFWAQEGDLSPAEEEAL
jgi:hypothetical protein